jgi:putative transposase
MGKTQMVVFRKFDPEKHHRRSIRLQQRDYSKPGSYFVTLCIIDKEKVLSSITNRRVSLTPAGLTVKKFWDLIPERFPNILLGESVIMPDHFHGIITILKINNEGSPGWIDKRHQNATPLRVNIVRRKMEVPKIIGWFKMNTAKEINSNFKTPGKSYWQRNYYERVIRNPVDLEITERYIRTNPARWK